MSVKASPFLGWSMLENAIAVTRFKRAVLRRPRQNATILAREIRKRCAVLVTDSICTA